jgi:pyruvate/2-oxoglutarate dehydrogenase complex dihydrolipoamide dehydrogenase (E3) component
LKYDYEIIVIGGGAAGLFAASVANALGAKILLIDKERLGGDCTWFGCIPSKALLHAASTANNIKSAGELGVKVPNFFEYNYDGSLEYVRSVVQDISTHHPPEVFQSRGIDVEFGTVKFIDKQRVSFNGQTLKAKKIILCTGSGPVVPPIEGLSDIPYLTNETVFALEKLPKSLVVLGGGPIGVELSQALARLGVEVSIVEMFDRLLFREDPEVSRILEAKLKAEGIKIFTGKKAVKFFKDEGEVKVVLEDSAGKSQDISGSQVLVVVGRAPNLKGLDLEKAGVEYSRRGVKVDSYLRTTNKNILACGDIVGPYMFSHVAAYQASICVRNSLFRRLAWQKVNYSNIAWATFTDPEVSRLGLSEEQARNKYRDIKIYTNDYKACDRAVTDKVGPGLVKIITDKKGYILGANIVGAAAGELMSGLIVAKAGKLTLDKLGGMLYIYPTLGELIKKTAAKSLVEKAGNPLVKFLIKIMRSK